MDGALRRVLVGVSISDGAAVPVSLTAGIALA